MQQYIPYQDGDEWHFLADKFVRKYGYELHHRDLFDLNKLTPVERRLYLSVRNKTTEARRKEISA